MGLGLPLSPCSPGSPVLVVPVAVGLGPADWVVCCFVVGVVYLGGLSVVGFVFVAVFVLLVLSR